MDLRGHHHITHEPAGADPLRWTLNKLLKGAGAGADPTEIDVPIGNAIIASGSYAGNDTANRAIAHGLGVIPKLIVIRGDTTGLCYFVYNVGIGTARVVALTMPVQVVSLIDTTNFYVGSVTSYPNSANANGEGYIWAAIR